MNLFDELPGFRLERLEIYNWGTFDQCIWPMDTRCQTAVLTGQNGSGKSTVVDALLTLLVDSRKRNYNMASGAGKRERNEKTYIWGQYSRTREDDDVDVRAKTLRDTDDYSTLLAVFYNDIKKQSVSIAQNLWVAKSGRVEKRFYIAYAALSIEQDFTLRNINPDTLPGDAKSYKSFKSYITDVRKALGLHGRTKALDLFNETVAVKEINSLNDFIRDHMLERGEPEKWLDTFREQYQDLNGTHESIQQARIQIEMLSPLVMDGKKYREYKAQIERLESAKEHIAVYVAHHVDLARVSRRS
jgi:uncharacterized protein YPO0396